MIYADLLKQYLVYKRYNIKEISIKGDKYIRTMEVKFNGYDNFNNEDLKKDIDSYLKEYYEYYGVSNPEILVKVI